MSDLRPKPLTPADCDLRTFRYMELEVARVRDSHTARKASGDGFRTAVLLWCASWHQVPAGSLPNDPELLTHFAGYGRDVKAFQDSWESGGSNGWIECSDGRLYHPVVAEKALVAWARRQTQLAQMETMRLARERRREEEARKADRRRSRSKNRKTVGKIDENRESLVQEACADEYVRSSEEITRPLGQDLSGAERSGAELTLPGKLVPSLRSGRAMPSPTDALWGEGLPILIMLSARPERACRALIGKLLKAADNDGGRVLSALRQAESVRPVEPVQWLIAAVGGKREGETRGEKLRRELRESSENGPVIEGRAA